jgi:hypothetical protein
MANVPKPKAGKGTPPPLAKTVENLERPDPAGQAPLNFKVPDEFKREFKTYAAQRGISMTKVLMDGFDLLKQHRA